MFFFAGEKEEEIPITVFVRQAILLDTLNSYVNLIYQSENGKIQFFMFLIKKPKVFFALTTGVCISNIKNFKLPLSLVAKPSTGQKIASSQITIGLNKPLVDLQQLFPGDLSFINLCWFLYYNYSNL